MPDAEPPHEHRPDPGAGPPRPYLNYSRRPTPPAADEPLTNLLQFVAGVAVYWSPLLAMKLLAVRYGWGIDAICGTWVLVMVIGFGAGGWMAGSLGWRWAMAGVMCGFIASLLVSALILREG
jgi:hypothetical protein